MSNILIAHFNNICNDFILIMFIFMILLLVECTESFSYTQELFSKSILIDLINIFVYLDQNRLKSKI